MFGIRKKLKQAPGAMEVLGRVSAEQTVVRIEVERAMLRFNTRISVRDQVVVVGKPAGIKGNIERGDLARFKVPWAKNYEVRMEIAALHVNLMHGSEGFLCKPPTGNTFPVKRNEERFNTSRFSNMQLHIPSVGLDFPLLDLSARGCRIKARSKVVEDIFKVNRSIRDGIIQVGDRFHISLESLTPRTNMHQMVGLEFSIRNQPAQHRGLKTLLGILAMQEVEMLAGPT